MSNERNFRKRCIWGGGVYTPAHKWKRKKTELQVTLKACINLLTLYYPEEWRSFTYLDPGFAIGSFKYIP